jgi:predicted HTH domain antitoxin
VVAAYLDGDISLGRAALLLGLSRFDLLARFNRLGLPAPGIA